MAFFRRIGSFVKKAVQTVIPGGSKGFREPREQLGSPVFKESEREQAQSFATREQRPSTIASGTPRDIQTESVQPGVERSSGRRVIDKIKDIGASINDRRIDLINQAQEQGPIEVDPNQGAIDKFFFGPKKTDGSPALVQGTLPISIGTPTLGTATKGAQSISAIKQLATKTGKSEKQITSMVNSKVLTQGVNSIVNNGKNAGLMRQIGTKITGSITWKALGAATLGLVVVNKILEKTLGGKNFGEFVGVEEAVQTISYPTTLAYQASDWESYELGKEARDELLAEPEFWDKVKSYIPFVNLGVKLDDYREAAITAGTILDKLAEDKREAEVNGTSEADKWAKARQEERDDDRQAVLFYNEQRKLQLQWEREAERDQRNEDARFWRKEREAQAEKEAEDRKAIADFWEAYRKQAQKLRDDSRPSNLNFGLI